MVNVPCAGIHLSGPNASKTALVVLRATGDLAFSALELVRVYEKIGSFGSLFSDERLISILASEGPFASVFVDCPLTAPPCVDCSRSSCPGAVRCEDVGVAFMLSVADRHPARGRRKTRPVNPQSQRLWDVVQMALGETHLPVRTEPTYSSNHAPLVVRARTLQRRLNSLDGNGVELRETNVPAVVDLLSARFLSAGGGAPAALAPSAAFRSFEHGLRFRRQLLDSLIKSGFLVVPAASGGIGGDATSEALRSLSGSVEVFQALVTAIVAVFHATDLTVPPVAGFEQAGGGWVHLPDFGKM